MNSDAGASTGFPNETARDLLIASRTVSPARIKATRVLGATLLDFGIAVRGSLRAGIVLAKACMGGLAEIAIAPCDEETFTVANSVHVRTDYPMTACLGCQYAGWPVQTDDYFAMGSGPMRLLRGKEPVLLDHQLSDSNSSSACGILESEKLPSEDAIRLIASDCDRSCDAITLAIAPSTSIAGNIQVVARSVETAMHKLHEIGFDVAHVISATGTAPLPPTAKPGDSIAGIGRTNDAILYGAVVTLWVDCDDESVAAVIDKVPSSASPDYGRPFANVFADYNHDFYQVDPGLFSPARVIVHNLKSGKTFAAGTINTGVLVQSFGT